MKRGNVRLVRSLRTNPGVCSTAMSLTHAHTRPIGMQSQYYSDMGDQKQCLILCMNKNALTAELSIFPSWNVPFLSFLHLVFKNHLYGAPSISVQHNFILNWSCNHFSHIQNQQSSTLSLVLEGVGQEEQSHGLLSVMDIRGGNHGLCGIWFRCTLSFFWNLPHPRHPLTPPSISPLSPITLHGQTESRCSTDIRQVFVVSLIQKKVKLLQGWLVRASQSRSSRETPVIILVWSFPSKPWELLQCKNILLSNSQALFMGNSSLAWHCLSD